MTCACCCVGVPRATLGAIARRDSDGQPACELCGRRLSKVKHTHRHGPGHACHPRCKARARPSKDEAVPVAAAVASVTPRKRRAASDPGELPAVAASPVRSRRIMPAKPAPLNKKQRADKIMRLLEETHARRMAAEAAVAQTAGAAAAAATATI